MMQKIRGVESAQEKNTPMPTLLSLLPPSQGRLRRRRLRESDNAQAAVAADSLLVVAANVVQALNDKLQIELMLNDIDTLPDGLGNADTLAADTGYFSAANVAACEAAGIDPLIVFFSSLPETPYSFVLLQPHLIEMGR